MSILRVAFDNSLARRNLAGTGTYASHVIRELSGAPDLDLKVFDGPDVAKGNDGFAARAARRVADLYWTHSQFPGLLRAGNFDVLHGPAFVLPRKCPVPSIVTVHDLTFRLFPKHFQGWWATKVESEMTSTLESVSAIICVSKQSKRDLLKFYSIPPGKVHVVYSGVDRSRFRAGVPLDPGWARSVGIRDGYVLHVGSLASRKNIPALLRAVAILKSRGKWGNRQVVLAGAKARGLAGATEVFETIQKLGLGDVVILPGHVPDEHVPGLYSQSSMLVMPSLYEGFGLPILESMAAGTPVVASNNSSIPEVAGDAAILVPTGDEQSLADAIENILEDPAVAQQLRERGLLQAAKFSWQRMGAETIRVYRSVTR
jgi:glycosyltransferase involved in cell wall biosynthesis